VPDAALFGKVGDDRLLLVNFDAICIWTPRRSLCSHRRME